jgi:hypothetical protein
MSHQLSLGRSFFLRLPTSLDRKLKLARTADWGMIKRRKWKVIGFGLWMFMVLD